MIGQQIKNLRESAGLSRLNLAQQLHISQQAVGKWERNESEPSMETLSKLSEIFGVSIDCIFTGKEQPPGENWIPVLGDVAAGIPIEAVENIVDYEEIDTALSGTGEYFGLRIKGSSMEPRIRDGDVVIVRRQEDASTGDTAVIMVNGDSATVKRIKKEPDGSIWLIPNNPAFDSVHFSPTEILDKPVRIIGKVVELRGKF